jgi:hypothetical protein
MLLHHAGIDGSSKICRITIYSRKHADGSQSSSEREKEMTSSAYIHAQNCEEMRLSCMI